jgi:hypothetical protein
MVLIDDPDRDVGSADAQDALLGEAAPRPLEPAAAYLVMSRERLATLSRPAAGAASASRKRLSALYVTTRCDSLTANCMAS